MSYLGADPMTAIDPGMLPATLQPLHTAKQEAASAASWGPPVIPGGPTWLTPKNLAIGGGITFATILAWMLLVPPKKKSAPVSGLGRFFGFGKRRRRRRH